MSRPLSATALSITAVGTLVLSILACGGGDKVPKPWVERYGQQEVIGNPGNVDDAARSQPRSPAADGSGLLPPNTEIIEPVVDSNLSPVDDNYDAVAVAGEIVACPVGTTLRDERKTKYQQHCVLENGVRHGPFLLWHTNGQIKEVGPYVGGKRHGSVTTWDRKGRKYSTYQWKNGSPVHGEVYK